MSSSSSVNIDAPIHIDVPDVFTNDAKVFEDAEKKANQFWKNLVTWIDKNQPSISAYHRQEEAEEDRMAQGGFAYTRLSGDEEEEGDDEGDNKEEEEGSDEEDGNVFDFKSLGGGDKKEMGGDEENEEGGDEENEEGGDEENEEGGDKEGKIQWETIGYNQETIDRRNMLRRLTGRPPITGFVLRSGQAPMMPPPPSSSSPPPPPPAQRMPPSSTSSSSPAQRMPPPPPPAQRMTTRSLSRQAALATEENATENEEEFRSRRGRKRGRYDV